MFKWVPNHLWVAASSWATRGVSASVQIVSVHYLLAILGEEKYSVFILLSGLAIWCSLSDFGIGNSILNFISERKAQNRQYSHLIIAATLLMLIVCLLLIIFLYFISTFMAGVYLKAYSYQLLNNKTELFFIATVIFCITTTSNLIYKIWYAEHIGWLSNLYTAISALLGLLGIYLASILNSKINNLFDIFVIFFSPALIISFSLLLFRFKKEFSNLKTISKALFLISSKKIIQRARPFFIFAIMGTIVLQTDLIVLSQKGTVKEIILYGVLLRVFNVVYFTYSAVLQAWWPVCTELRVKKQWIALKKNIRFTVMLGAIAILFLTLIIFFLQDFIFSILGLHNIPKGSFSLFALFSLYFIIRAWCDTYAVLLQTIGNMKPLFIIVPIQAVINILLQWYLVSELSLIGILLGSIISFGLTVAIYLPYKFNQLIKKDIQKQ